MALDFNPYASPEGPNDPLLRIGSGRLSRAVIAMGVGVIVVYAVVFAVIGGLVAVILNLCAPGYYPGVFPYARHGDALTLGVGTGILQGLTLGFWIGAAVSIGLGWFRQLHFRQCLRSLAILTAFGSGCAVVGTLFGYGLGNFAPGYYQNVINGGSRAGFHPIDVGIGLGCSQGLMVGAVVGTVVVVLLAWRRSRMTRFHLS